MIVCIDNHILVWGIRQIATPGQEEMIERASLLLETLDSNKAHIVVPAPVVTEFLMGVPPARQADTLSVLSRRFVVAPLDLGAAAIAAQVWIEHRNSGRVIADPPPDGVATWRAKIKVDAQILGVAVARKANVLYTHDRNLRRMAEGRIPARDIPPLTKSRQLLIDIP